jgi:hypothetical protein
MEPVWLQHGVTVRTLRRRGRASARGGDVRRARDWTRCGGAATAMLLARAGLDVLLVDRAAPPSDIPHGHFVGHGPARLAKWGLLDRVPARTAPP